MKHIKEFKMLFVSKAFWNIVLFIFVVGVNMRFLRVRTMTNIDEFTSLAVPAYYAGYDWSSYVSTLKFHGYGYTILFTPLFALLNDSLWIYRVLMVGAIVLRVLMAMITLYICADYFLVDIRIAALIAVVCEIGTLKADDGMPLSTMTELPLSFLILVSVFFLLKSIKCGGKRAAIYRIMACFCVAYMYLVHSRAIIVWFSIMVAIILYTIFEKKLNTKIFFYLILFIAILTLIILVDSTIQSSVWKVASGDELANSVVTVANKSIMTNIKKIFSLELLKISFLTFFSLLGTLTVYTGGMFWFFTAINFSAFFILWKKREKKDIVLLLLIGYGFISFFIMNISISLSSTGNVMNNNLRWLTYIRYCKPFAYLFVLTALICLFKGIFSKKVVGCICAIGVIISIFVLYTWTASYLENSGYGLQHSILSRYWYDNQNESVQEYFAKMSIICVDFSLFLFLFWFFNFKFKLISVYLIFSLLISNVQYNYNIYRDSINSGRTDQTEQLVDSNLLDQCVLCVGGTDTFAMYLHWGLYKKNVLYYKNREDVNLTDNVVYLTNSLKEAQVIAPQYIYILDTNEYLFTSDSAIAETMETAGYETRQ